MALILDWSSHPNPPESLKKIPKNSVVSVGDCQWYVVICPLKGQDNSIISDKWRMIRKGGSLYENA
jgi:hypothetical protein